MNIPKKIKVGGIVWKIKIIKDLDKLGESNLATKTISLREMNQQGMEQTFIHELFHTMNSEVSEIEVEMFCQMLYGIIIDNPKIFK